MIASSRSNQCQFQVEVPVRKILAMYYSSDLKKPASIVWQMLSDASGAVEAQLREKIKALEKQVRDSDRSWALLQKTSPKALAGLEVP